MSEKLTERKLVQAVRSLGGLCPKWISPGLNGVPDRIVLLPGGIIGFVEVKAPGKKPRPIQSLRLNQLLQLGFPVCVLDDPKQIPQLLDQLKNLKGGQPKGPGGGAERPQCGMKRGGSPVSNGVMQTKCSSTTIANCGKIGKPLVAPQGETPV